MTRRPAPSYSLALLIAGVLLGLGLLLVLLGHPRLAYATLVLVFAVVLAILRELVISGDR
ncbi:hypothetical protein K7957_05875 [Sphingomonas yunnanensis]|uniref:hypothetical protein n=1 Tax=Sphingomonas yunnanensis TaxID=310400 RepID=UPI001CA60F8B|nr:hypothetical protein [Sphingomonas yunnanensis]MBY9062458.1 hypothetical protein [Sphingomonas yunnanensis]